VSCEALKTDFSPKGQQKPTGMEVVIPDHREVLKKNHSKNDIVARWVIPIRGKLYDIELEHGTISGKRVIWVNGDEILRRDMMYRLVGEDTFFLEDKRCIVHVSSIFSEEKLWSFDQLKAQ
jgi:hypothetical protein